MALLDSATLRRPNRAWEVERLAPVTERFPERRSRFHHQQRRYRSAGGLCAVVMRVSPKRGRRLRGTWRRWASPASIRARPAVQPNMYRGRLWTMRQYAGFGSAAESNAHYKYLIEKRTDRPLGCLRPAARIGGQEGPRSGRRRSGVYSISSLRTWRRCSTSTWARSRQRDHQRAGRRFARHGDRRRTQTGRRPSASRHRAEWSSHPRGYTARACDVSRRPVHA